MLIAGSQKLIKNLNRLAVLRRIRMQPGISRVELAQALGLTKTTVGQLIDELLHEGWLTEDAAIVTGALGRRRTPLSLERHRHVLIGADMNGERVIVTATNLCGEIRQQRVTLAPSGSAEVVLDTLADEVKDVLQHLGPADSRICGIGVGVPGTVKAEDGMLRTSERTGWRDLPVRDMLQQRLAARGMEGFPVLVERAVGCTALYHFEYERAAEEEPLLYVHVGHGVAASLAARYALHSGCQGMAGAIAHTSLGFDGPQCDCGRWGCSNVVASLRALERETGRSAGEMRSLAAQGDPAVRAALCGVGDRLGVLLFNLCLMQDPARLFVGGPAFQIGPDYVLAAQARLDAMCAQSGMPAPRIEVMRFDTHHVALGAATLVMHSVVCRAQ